LTTQICQTTDQLYSLPVCGFLLGAIAVPSVTRSRCRGHRCAGGVRQWRRATVATPGECNVKLGRAVARSGEWAQHFSNASCFSVIW